MKMMTMPPTIPRRWRLANLNEHFFFNVSDWPISMVSALSKGLAATVANSFEMLFAAATTTTVFS